MSTQGRPMRVQPSPIVGAGLAVLYVAIFSVGFLVAGVDYDAVADSTGNVMKAIVLPVGVGAVALLLLTAFLGWWRPVFRDEDRAPRWTLLMPAFMLAAIIVGLATADYGARDTSFVAWLLIGTLAVGVAEEVSMRGVLLVGLRARFGEVGVWFWTSLAFGAFHGLNIVFGQAVDATLWQVVFAFVFGSVLYACRRATGMLLVPIILHALWDFTTFLSAGEGATTASGLQGVIAYGAIIVLIVALAKRSLFPTGAAPATARAVVTT